MDFLKKIISGDILDTGEKENSLLAFISPILEQPTDLTNLFLVESFSSFDLSLLESFFEPLEKPEPEDIEQIELKKLIENLKVLIETNNLTTEILKTEYLTNEIFKDYFYNVLTTEKTTEIIKDLLVKEETKIIEILNNLEIPIIEYVTNNINNEKILYDFYNVVKEYNLENSYQEVLNNLSTESFANFEKSETSNIFKTIFESGKDIINNIVNSPIFIEKDFVNSINNELIELSTIYGQTTNIENLNSEDVIMTENSIINNITNLTSTSPEIINKNINVDTDSIINNFKNLIKTEEDINVSTVNESTINNMDFLTTEKINNLTAPTYESLETNYNEIINNEFVTINNKVENIKNEIIEMINSPKEKEMDKSKTSKSVAPSTKPKQPDFKKSPDSSTPQNIYVDAKPRVVRPLPGFAEIGRV